MAIVKEMMVGNTRISFADDAYVNKTPEELEAVLDEARRVAWGILRRAAYREAQAAEEQQKQL